MLWMVATGVLFTVLNALLKKVSHELDPWLAGWLRYAIGAVVMLPPVLRAGLGQLMPRNHRLQFVRGVFHAGGLVLWFTALPFITLAELTAIGFTGPLFICLGAVLFLLVVLAVVLVKFLDRLRKKDAESEAREDSEERGPIHETLEPPSHGPSLPWLRALSDSRRPGEARRFRGSPTPSPVCESGASGDPAHRERPR